MQYTYLHDLQGIIGLHVVLHAKPFYTQLLVFTCICQQKQVLHAHSVS
jgi:hypothetical protein